LREQEATFSVLFSVFWNKSPDERNISYGKLSAI
jgi:hypothetical protein